MSNFTCNNCTHDQLLSRWISSFYDGAMVPVIVLFKNQPSLDDIKSHKQIDYTDDIELIKSYGGNVTKTWNIIHATAAKIPKDKVLLLANNTLVASVDPDSPGKIAVMIPSPLKQLKLGIMAKDVQCNQGLVPVIKTSDNSSACVTAVTAKKLVERGWGTMISQTSGHEFISKDDAMVVFKNFPYKINYPKETQIQTEF